MITCMALSKIYYLAFCVNNNSITCSHIECFPGVQPTWRQSHEGREPWCMGYAACLSSRSSWVFSQLWYGVSKEQNVSSRPTRKDSALWGTTVTKKYHAESQTDTARIPSPLSGGHCHLILLTTQFSLREHKSGPKLHWFLFTKPLLLIQSGAIKLACPKSGR